MSVFKYVGRTNYFKGKTLWEIVGNLKDYGVGRIIIRSVYQRYPELSYMKIVKVEARPNDIIYIKQSGIDVPQNFRKVHVWVEKVFRGRKDPGLFQIESSSYKADYQLIPKDEEEKYTTITQVLPDKTIPAFIEFPPLLKEIILLDHAQKGLPPPDLKLRLNLNRSRVNRYKTDTTNTEVLPIDIHKPSSKKYFEGLPLNE
ncbi:mitochondrial ribosomal protein S34 [Arctopsyche grandis]|uniref:mitochondrial ribosomal protein S34 n=1 Tax=Arctopsyche grandis TaxID=121162 RepID=UPI00406D9809